MDLNFAFLQLYIIQHSIFDELCMRNMHCEFKLPPPPPTKIKEQKSGGLQIIIRRTR